MAEEKQRAAAICDNCGTIHAVRLSPDGEIRPIGTVSETGCTCEDGNLQIMNNDTAVPEAENKKS